MLYLYLVSVVLYSIGLLWGFLSFLREKKRSTASATLHYPTVSIVIAFRNEEENLAELLNSLSSQTYPPQACSIILINDHSSDTGVQLVENFKCKYPVQLLHLPHLMQGKKNAIRFALPHIQSDYILFTDADCTHSPYWVDSMVHSAIQNQKPLVQGMVSMHGKGFFGKFQELEFLSVQMVSFFAHSAGFPISANGASLLCKTDIYKKLAEKLNLQYPSGDDIFILNAAIESGIKLGMNTNSVVRTKALLGFSAYLNQRRRWAGKFKYSAGLPSVMVSLLISITNFLSLLLLITHTADVAFWSIFIFKVGLDSILLYQVQKNWNLKLHPLFICFISVLYPIYFIAMLLNAFIPKYIWKERILRHKTNEK